MRAPAHGAASPLRVLYLAPPSAHPRAIAEYTFLDEEMHALAAAGVEVHTISTTPADPSARGALHPHLLPRERAPHHVVGTAALLLRHPRRGDVARHFRRQYHTARIERFAARLVRTHRIDVIHSHFGWPGGVGGALASRAARVPLVSSFRGMDLNLDPSIKYGLRRDPIYDQNLRVLLRAADRIVYVSGFMQRRGLELGADAARTLVLPKGVAADRFRPATEGGEVGAERGIRRPIVLTVAGLVPLKGIDTILRALGRLRAQHDFSFVVCGEGPEREALQALAGQLGLADRTHFLGRVSRSEIPGVFASSDVFVLASRMEAAGNVVLEAMASGCPVVCTDSGGPPEYVRHGEAGFVVPVGDDEAMSARLAQLLGDRVLREEMGRAGRRLVEREFGYDRMIARFIALYEEVVAERVSVLTAPAPPRSR